MKISVENLGAISKAEVDLSKDLIILTGENNTGKTYLAYLIYSLYYEKVTSIEIEIQFEEYFEDEKQTIEVSLNDVFKANINQLKEAKLNKLKKFLPRVFSCQQDYFQDCKIDLIFNQRRKYLDKIEATEINDGITIEGIEIGIYKGKDSNILKLEIDDYNSQIEFNEIKEKYINDTVLDYLQQILFERVFPITAERQGISIFHEELFLNKTDSLERILNSNGKDLKPTVELIREKTNRYYLPIQENLKFLESLNLYSTKRNSSLISDLESIINGKVRVTDKGSLEFEFSKRNRVDNQSSQKVVDIYKTSSTTKSISILILYLTYILKKGDFIIIDEPEINLHPDNQRKIGQFIGRLVNEGYKVMLSTHSEYILREMNTLISLKTGIRKKPEDGKDLMSEYGYNENQLLSPEQVGVYLFRQEKEVEALDIGELGFSVETIDKVTNEMIDTTNNILFTLHDY